MYLLIIVKTITSYLYLMLHIKIIFKYKECLFIRADDTTDFFFQFFLVPTNTKLKLIF